MENQKCGENESCEKSNFVLLSQTDVNNYMLTIHKYMLYGVQTIYLRLANHIFQVCKWVIHEKNMLSLVTQVKQNKYCVSGYL